MQEKLKPCPFCGNEAYIKEIPSSGTYYSAECKECCATSGINYFTGRKGAINSWNARVDTAQWMPMETIPITGRILMWWTPINNNPLAECAIIAEVSLANENYLRDEWKPSKYWDGHEYQDLARITRWMPLPKPPEKE